MKNRRILIIVFIISTLTIASSTSIFPVSAQTKYSVWGYILDSNGQSITGAEVNIQKAGIPDAYSNASGYYSMNVPIGTYQIYVWPPYDSHFIHYSEANVTVNSAMNKNFTLLTGCKISGYVINSSGTPMINATVIFWIGSNEFYASGFLTDQNGYYYANMPAGTYTIAAQPQSLTNSAYKNQCTPFTPYTETNFIVNCDITRNITVDVAQPTPTSTPNPTPTLTPNPTSTPSPTPSASTTNPPSLQPTTTTPKSTPTNNPTPEPKPETLTVHDDYSMTIIIIGIVVAVIVIGVIIIRRTKHTLRSSVLLGA